jgi:hypothetical protein
MKTSEGLLKMYVRWHRGRADVITFLKNEGGISGSLPQEVRGVNILLSSIMCLSLFNRHATVYDGRNIYDIIVVQVF